jgi:hypothetical protein
MYQFVKTFGKYFSVISNIVLGIQCIPPSGTYSNGCSIAKNFAKRYHQRSGAKIL